MENYRRRRKRRPNILAIVMILVFIAVVVTAAVLLIQSVFGNASDRDTSSSNSQSAQEMYDPDAKKGALPGRDTADDEADPEQFSYVINTQPEFKNGKAAGNILIENPAHNTQLMRVEIEDEDGELLYTSGYIRPGWHIETIKLESNLKKGRYFAQAYIHAYDKTSRELVSTAYQELEIVIKK